MYVAPNIVALSSPVCSWVARLRTDAFIAAKPRSRSRVGNGTEILSGVDGRSAVMRRYKDILGDIARQSAGEMPASHMILARRAAAISLWCEGQEAALARGEPFDMAAFMHAADTLSILMHQIGIANRPDRESAAA